MKIETSSLKAWTWQTFSSYVTISPLCFRHWLFVASQFPRFETSIYGDLVSQITTEFFFYASIPTMKGLCSKRRSKFSLRPFNSRLSVNITCPITWLLTFFCPANRADLSWKFSFFHRRRTIQSPKNKFTTNMNWIGPSNLLWINFEAGLAGLWSVTQNVSFDSKNNKTRKIPRKFKYMYGIQFHYIMP